MTTRRFALRISLALIGCATACHRPVSAPPAPVGPSNVVVVLVDTLRADHMSTYGYVRQTTPFIDRMAETGIVFERARSQASCTFPSVNSIFTSRYPGPFLRQGPGEMGIPEHMPTIAEILRDAGYSTAAVSASHIVRATPSDYNPNGGFDRGFETFVEGCVWLHGSCLNNKVFDQLDGIEEPFFLYIHYMEPHSPYQPPERFRRRFALDYDGFEFIREGDPNPIAEMLYGDGPRVEIGERDLQHLVDLYDDEILTFDGVFKRLVARLDEQGLLDRTLLVLASDHGEEFLEHGHMMHCRGIWSTLSHVPLILWLPGTVEGRRVGAAVENLDIVPTILDYLGIPADGHGFEGESLRPLIEGRESRERYAFADQGKYRSVDDGRFHLIFDGAEKTATLFETGNDPLEQHDLFAPNHPAAVALTAALNDWLAATGQALRFDEALAAARAKEEELRALGYLQ